MLSLGFTVTGRRATIVACAVGIASAGACSDATTAPQARPASVPTSGAQPYIIQIPAVVTVKITAAWGTPIYELPSVKFNAAGDTVVVKDNSPADQNSTLGTITVALPKSMSYGACLFQGTVSFGVDFTKSHCKTVYTTAWTVDLGTLIMQEYPVAVFDMHDINTLAFVPGGQMKLIAPDGTAKIASDGGVFDIDGANNGHIAIRAKGPGKYTFCETKPPTGYALTNPLCRTLDLDWNMGVGTAVLHMKQAVILKLD